MSRRPIAVLILFLLSGLSIGLAGIYGVETYNSEPCLCTSSGCSGGVVCNNGCPSPSGQLVACPSAPKFSIAETLCGIIVLMSGILAYTGAARRPGMVRVFGIVALASLIIIVMVDLYGRFVYLGPGEYNAIISSGGGLPFGVILGLIGGLFAFRYKG